MRVIFEEADLTPFPHGREGDRFVVRFEPTAAFTADGRLYNRGWGLDVPGTVRAVSAGRGLSQPALRLQRFELATTSDSSNPAARWRATILTAAGETVERWRAFSRFALTPDMGAEMQTDAGPARVVTLADVYAANERARREQLQQSTTQTETVGPLPPAGVPPAQSTDPGVPTPVIDTSRRGDG